MAVLIELLVSLLARPSALLRAVVRQAFRAFCEARPLPLPPPPSFARPSPPPAIVRTNKLPPRVPPLPLPPSPLHAGRAPPPTPRGRV